MQCTYGVKGLIEAGEALTPGGSVGRDVVRVPAKQLSAQHNENEDEEDEQQHEVLQRHHALQTNTLSPTRCY